MTKNLASAKKAMILEAAAKLFRDKGYKATSMRDLAAAVNLKASSLYNHIGSKEELLKVICFANANHFLKGLEEIDLQKISAFDKIKELLQLHITIALEDITSITSFNDEWRQLSEPDLSAFLEMRKDYEKRFIQIIEKAQEDKTIKALDPTFCLYTILSSTRWVYDYNQQSKKKKPEQIKNTIQKIILDGICLT